MTIKLVWCANSLHLLAGTMNSISDFQQGLMEITEFMWHLRCLLLKETEVMVTTLQSPHFSVFTSWAHLIILGLQGVFKNTVKCSHFENLTISEKKWLAYDVLDQCQGVENFRVFLSPSE